MSTNLATPAPAAPPAAPPSAPSTPSAAPSAPAPSSTPLTSTGSFDVRAMIRNDIASARPGETKEAPTPEPGQPPAEAAPGQPSQETAAQLAELEQETAAEEIPEVQPQQAETPEEVTFEDKPSWTPEKVWSQVYPSHKFVQALKQPIEKGGIGHQPSVEDVRLYYDSYADRVSMESDFSSDDPNSAAQFVNRWFGADQTGSFRDNYLKVASVLPAALARANPQAYKAMSVPVLSGYREGLWQRAEYEQNPEIRSALLAAAQILEHDITGKYRPLDDNGKAIQPTPDPERVRLEADRRAFNEEKSQATQQRVQQWQNSLASRIHSQIGDKIDEALAPLKSVHDKAPRIYNSAKSDFLTEVQNAVKKDAQWSVYEAMVNQASRTQTAESADAVQGFYLEMASRAISNLRRNFLKEAGVAVVRQSEQRHQQLQQSASRQAPTQNGANSQKPSIAAAAIERKPGESNVQFLQRRMAADRAAAAMG